MVGLVSSIALICSAMELEYTYIQLTRVSYYYYDLFSTDVNVNLNQTKVTVHETNKTVSMCVNKDVETDTSLSVLLTTINGTAKSEID